MESLDVYPLCFIRLQLWWNEKLFRPSCAKSISVRAVISQVRTPFGLAERLLPISASSDALTDAGAGLWHCYYGIVSSLQKQLYVPGCQVAYDKTATVSIRQATSTAVVARRRTEWHRRILISPLTCVVALRWTRVTSALSSASLRVTIEPKCFMTSHTFPFFFKT